MNLDSGVKDRVIMFIGGGTQFITGGQETMIFSQQATIAGGVRIDGNFLSLSSISRIISRDEYYNQHPEKRPPAEYKSFDHQEFGNIRNGLVHKEALESMVRGMKGYIESDRYQGTQAPKDLLKMMENRLEEFSNQPQSA